MLVPVRPVRKACRQNAEDAAKLQQRVPAEAHYLFAQKHVDMMKGGSPHDDESEQRAQANCCDLYFRCAPSEHPEQGEYYHDRGAGQAQNEKDLEGLALIIPSPGMRKIFADLREEGLEVDLFIKAKKYHEDGNNAPETRIHLGRSIAGGGVRL